MSRFCASVAFVLALLVGQSSAQTIRIAAASDLEPALPAILDQFRQTTGITAEATYQASAALTTQIMNGAPFDLFLSANLEYPQKLIAAGLAQGLDEGTPGAPIVYARGTLVLWTREDTHLPEPSIDLLRSPLIKHLAIANPDRAPYGKAAVAFLEKASLYEPLKPRFVIAENIAQAAQFVESGNADAGLISMTSALTPRLVADGRFFVIPAELYPPIEQGAVVVKKSAERVAANRFLDFLMSAAVQEQLTKFGLKPGRPAPEKP